MSEKTRKVLKILSIAVVIGLILVLIGACINLYVIHTGRQAYLFGKGHARQSCGLHSRAWRRVKAGRKSERYVT